MRAGLLLQIIDKEIKVTTAKNENILINNYVNLEFSLDNIKNIVFKIIALVMLALQRILC